MIVNLERVNVPVENLDQADPIDIDVEMDGPSDDDGYPNIVRGRTIQDAAAIKLAKNILTYIGLGCKLKPISEFVTDFLAAVYFANHFFLYFKIA